MEGFGVHTFRLVNAGGQVHVREVPLAPEDRRGHAHLGRVGEALRRRSGFAAPRSPRRDRRRATFPEFEFSVQAFDQKTADKFPFDILDATKLIPEELVPLTPVGRMVLDRNPDNFFAETEQVAFHPGPRRAGHRLHQRSAAAGPAVLLHRHAADAPRRRQLPRDPDQPAEVPDAQLPARRRAAHGRQPGPGRVRAEQPGARRPARVAGGADSRRCPRTTAAARCASARRRSPITTARRRCSGAR